MAINLNPGTAPFRPEVWAAALMGGYTKNLVYAQGNITNRNYLGQIQQIGDTVHVSSLSTPTIRPYDAQEDLVIEDLSMSDNSYKIDQGSYFAFRVEDVEQVQAAGPLRDPATQQAATRLRDDVDTYIANLIKSGAGSKLGTSEVIDDDPTRQGGKTAFRTLVKLSEALNDNSVPTTGRYVIVGPKFHSALLMDPRFTRVDASGNEDGLRNGIVGRAVGFDVLMSNNVPSTAGRELISAGVPDAVAFTEQINKVEMQREERRFADLVKGLLIFGGAVFQPQGLATADVSVVEPADPAPAA